MYFVSSNTHSLVNIVTGVAREREESLVEFVETLPEDDILREELAAFREGRAEGSWENFLYFVARLYFDSHGAEGRAARRRSEQESGVSHLPSSTALRVPAQVMPLAKLHPERLDPRLGDVDAEALARERRGDREHRLPARRGGVQHPARGGRGHRRPCAACTCSARRRR